MGQRSQIYVRISELNQDGSTKNCTLFPMYYQWNYQERMISRIKHTVEWLEDGAKYVLSDFQGEYQQKLTSILSTNFDMQDVVIPCDIAKEIYMDEWNDDKSYQDKEQLNDALFFEQDNNNGQGYIDVIIKNDKTEISYCFADFNGQYLGDGNAYMDNELFDEEKDYEYRHWPLEYATLHEKYEDLKDVFQTVSYTEENIQWLKDNAKLMSVKELDKFRSADYRDVCFNHVINAYQNSLFTYEERQLCSYLKEQIKDYCKENDISVSLSDFINIVQMVYQNYKDGKESKDYSSPYEMISKNEHLDTNKPIQSVIEKYFEDDDRLYKEDLDEQYDR